MSSPKRYDPINSDGTCGMCVEDADYGAYVEYADYAALEAENARLRRAAQTNWNEFAEREAPRAQLAAILGGMGEVVGFDRNAAYSACPESGCDWGSFYVGWKAAAAQHQRIIAAMAAEVERKTASRDKLAAILRDLVPGCKWRIMRPRIDAALLEIENGDQ